MADFPNVRRWGSFFADGNSMFVTIQFPLADVRRFLNAPTGKLSAPPWPLADPNRHFVRSIGPVRSRDDGVPIDWPGEDVLCDARGAVKYALGPGKSFGGAEGGTLLRPVYRRYFAGGSPNWAGVVSRLDLKFHAGDADPAKLLSERHPTDNFQRAAYSCLTLPVNVPGQTRRPRELVTAGSQIAKRILHVTTSTADPPPAIEDWWVTPGTPLVLLETDYDPDRHPGFDTLERFGLSLPGDDEPIAVHHPFVLRRMGVTVPAWLVLQIPNAEPAKVRNLRVHLWRLHNERAVLKCVLERCIEEKLDPAASKKLQDYLAQQSKRLRRAKFDGYPQQELLAHAYRLENAVNQNDLAKLEGILEAISPGISASVMPVARSSEQSGTPTEKHAQVFIQQMNGIVMVDDKSQNFGNIGNIGAVVGGNARVSGGSFQGSGLQLSGSAGEKIDPAELIAELADLRAAMRGKATEPDHDIAVAGIAEAEKAAAEGDQGRMLSALRKAGKWALDVAGQIGATVAAEVLKQALTS